MWRNPLKDFMQLLTRAPSLVVRQHSGTLLLALAIVLTSVVAGTLSDTRHTRLVETFGFDLDALQHLRFWAIPFSPFVQGDNGVGVEFWGLMALTIVALGLLNWRTTQLWTFTIFFGTHAISAVLAILLLLLIAKAGSSEAKALLHTPDTGVSACAYGSLAAAFVLFRGPSRAVLVAALSAWLVASFFYERLDVAITHTIAASVGAAVAFLKPWVPRESSRPIGLAPEGVRR